MFLNVLRACNKAKQLQLDYVIIYIKTGLIGHLNPISSGQLKGQLKDWATFWTKTKRTTKKDLQEMATPNPAFVCIAACCNSPEKKHKNVNRFTIV